MQKLFLDSEKPITTCAAENCQDCPVQNRVQCHFDRKSLARFLAIAFPPFIVGGAGIAQINSWLLVPWIAICLSYFGLFEIRAMCSHCPHYAQPGTKTLQCWANYGSPKLWKFRPGPMSLMERFTFFAGLVLIAGYPLAALVIGGQWPLLIAYVVLIAVMGVVMARTMCMHCMNFACPFNLVDGATRQAFFARNPIIARAWRAGQSNG